MPGPHPETAARQGQHPPAWRLEQLAFEPDAAPPEAAVHRATCPACGAAVAGLRSERDAFLAARPTRPFVAAVVERATRPAAADAGRWWPGRWLLVAGAAAAAALLTVGRAPAPEEGAVRFKGDGGPSLTLFVSRGGGPARPLEAGAALHPGDVVRFGVVTPRPGHVLVASIDERGRYARYHPAAEGADAPVDGREALQVLPGSVELDGSLGREWIVLVVSPRPLDERRVEEALGRAFRERAGDRLGPVALDAEVRVVAVAKVPP